jgi:hypothetical protein
MSLDSSWCLRTASYLGYCITLIRSELHTLAALFAAEVCAREAGSVDHVQATFLRSPIATAPPQNQALAAELAALGDEALDSRCRRSGVSSKGGREAQVCCCNRTFLAAILGQSPVLHCQSDLRTIVRGRWGGCWSCTLT